MACVEDGAGLAWWTRNKGTKTISLLSNHSLQGLGCWGAHEVPHDFQLGHCFHTFPIQNSPFQAPSGASNVQLWVLPWVAFLIIVLSRVWGVFSRHRECIWARCWTTWRSTFNCSSTQYQWGKSQCNTALGTRQRQICQIIWPNKVALNFKSCQDQLQQQRGRKWKKI